MPTRTTKTFAGRFAVAVFATGFAVAVYVAVFMVHLIISKNPTRISSLALHGIKSNFKSINLHGNETSQGHFHHIHVNNMARIDTSESARKTVFNNSESVSSAPYDDYRKSRVCRWTFVKYVPSALEKYWTDNIANLQGRVCEVSNNHLAAIRAWVKASSDNIQQTDFPKDIFSQFTFQNDCTGETITDHIEPLAGLTRSPLFCLYGFDYLVSKDYLVVSWNVSRKLTSASGYVPKAYYFDLGASLYNSGSGGASQQWFVETYEARGVRWDGIFAWEMKPQFPTDVWSLIPARLKPIYHWYNVPVSSVPGHADNALDYIRRTVRPEDFVLVKIDIDTSPVEEALVEQILASDELLGLIDEFYFEHHVRTQPMLPYWKKTVSATHRLADTYRIFSTLRSKGILAHSWV